MSKNINFYQKYLQKFFETCFSVKNTDWYHKTITVFGIKISILKNEIKEKQKESPYYYYKENNIDITTIPSATGKIRDIQLANLVLLKELDYVCKQNNLTYWLDGGTLIGAVRHKGFVPWDDDIDTAMLREDYVQIIDAFKKSSRNPDIYADYFRTDKSPSACYIKIQHRKCPYLFVDIFPWDYYGEILSKKEQIKRTKKIKQIAAELDSSVNISMPNEELLPILKSTMKTKILNRTNSQEEVKGDFVWGIDYHHLWENWFTAYDVLYPIKTIEFEGYDFPCMNNPDAFLTRLYRNYMDYPKKLGRGHSMYIDMPDEEKEIIKDLVKEAQLS